ncbi:MAG: bifunctional methylenetetrahydrofolate dehydrogenase/methenyltetrahydrofolate cyclohydrolase FolD [Acidobacteria bacterium]|nr:bifunctional methylenetetrahydrofolate dehydrogenase/methenyltetrahydrofolate cyclohydrolase FolD [Acidobacteriota bacterium]
MPTVLSGVTIRDQILSELKPRVAALPRPPGLAVVLVGHDPGSEVYVRNKIKACADLGIYSDKLTPPEDISTAGMLDLIAELNARPDIDGILVQMPLPKQIDSRAVLEAVAADKDADGFHPTNVGHLVAGRPAPRACTPAGIMEMLRRYGIDPAGKHAVVIGRSDIVGKPMGLLLLHANATVTICHSRTANLAEEARRADILVAAIGRPAFVTADFIKPGAVVIDVGMNRIADPAAPKGTRLIGDVDPEAMATVSSAYTPVPGGVGPLTIAMLMANTVELAEQRLRKSS